MSNESTSTKNSLSGLSERCHNYLMSGPPQHMEDYVPESLTEIIIAHGAQKKKLDDGLMEIGQIILMESDDYSDITDDQIREYMQEGTKLMQEVIEAQ